MVMMFSTTITVIPRKPANQNDFLVQISKQIVSQFQIEKRENLKIAIGRTMITAKIQVIELKASEIYVPETIFAKLCLPVKSYKFQACYRADISILLLGPVIGLLTNFSTNQEEGPHFRSIHKFCEELHQGISETGGLFYVFSYDHFSREGYYFHNGKWFAAELPLPDVIYNRIHSRRLETNKAFNRFRRQLETLMIPLFNDRFLSKWEVYENIIQEELLISNIPETKLLSKENLSELAQKFETVFIKPVNGSQGRNIIKLNRTGENQFTCQTSMNQPIEIWNKILSLDDFYHLIKPLLQDRIYLVQQGISFVPYDSRAMDFRVLCHKNRFHKWKVTSIVARVAAEDMFVSNIAKGGTIISPLRALKTIFIHQKAFEALTQMRELALDAADVVSRSTAGITGELGIDIGIDLAGKPWLIEVNSKPSKDFEEGLGKIRPSAKAIIQFSTKLAFDSISERKFE
jgi:glutathione synthase/RimK-type ligase-like ATP-grasp enzyme